MADLGTQIQVAKSAGYSDADIAAHLATDPTLGAKISQAKAAGYGDADIVSHLAGPPKDANAFAKAGRIMADEFHKASDAYKADMQSFADKGMSGKGHSLGDYAAPVMDAARAAMAPVKGVADAAFGDKPIVGGMTGGDLAQFAIPVAGEMAAARGVATAAKTAGVTARTMENTLASSKAPVSIARPNPTAAAPANDIAAKVQAFDQAGVRPTFAAMGDGNARFAKAISENPLAGGRTRANLQASVADTSVAVDRAAQSYGQPAARGAAGEAVQQGVQDFNARFSQRASNLYDPAFAKVEAAQQQAVAAAKSAADLKTAKGGQSATAAPVIAPTATSDALAAINGRGNSPALKDLFSSPQVTKLTQAAQDPGSLSFQDLRDARTWVREAQGNEQLRGSIGSGNLKSLEGALTQDINANAEAIAGPQVARQLKQADQFYRLGSERIQGSLQKFVGRDGNASGESAYDLIVRAAGDKGGADTARLTALKNSLKPSEWGDVAASTISRMGQAPDGTFSVNRFVTGFDNLSPQGKDLIYGKGALRSELENLAKVARMQKGVEQAANHSNTASAAQAIATTGGLLTPHAAIPTAVGLGGMALTGEILTNPAAVRWLARIGKAQTVSPAATSSAVGRLGSAARSNPALVPLYQQAVKGLQPSSLPAAADSTNPSGQTQ